MDKFSGYVIITYVVTFGLLIAYLLWMWARLKAVKDETPLTEQGGQP